MLVKRCKFIKQKLTQIIYVGVWIAVIRHISELVVAKATLSGHIESVIFNK